MGRKGDAEQLGLCFDLKFASAEMLTKRSGWPSVSSRNPKACPTRNGVFVIQSRKECTKPHSGREDLLLFILLLMWMEEAEVKQRFQYSHVCLTNLQATAVVNSLLTYITSAGTSP